MMERQPLVWLAVAFATGIGFAAVAGVAVAVPVSVALSGLWLMLAWLVRTHRLSATLLLLLAAACSGVVAWGVHNLRSIDTRLQAFPTYSRIAVVGTAMGPIEHRYGRTSWTLHLKAFEQDGCWWQARGRLRVEVSDSLFLDWPATLLLRGILLWPKERQIPGFPGPRLRMLSRGLQATLRVRNQHDMVVITSSAQPLQFRLKKITETWRIRLSRRLDLDYPPAAAGLIKGLLLGLRDDIPTRTFDAFARSGVIHVLAVSGLHVGFVALIVWTLGAFLQIPRRWLYVVVMLAIWVYAAMTGLRPPVVRAATMAMLASLGLFLDRPLAGSNFLGGAALLLLCLQPGSLFDPGFQLSFSAVGGIFYAYPRFHAALRQTPAGERLMRWKVTRWILSLFLVSLAAQFGSLPVSLYHFGRVSFIGLFANLFFVPGAFLVVACAFLALATAPIWSLASLNFAAVAGFFVTQGLRLADWFSNVPHAYLETWYPPIYHLILLILILLLLIEFRNRQARNHLILILLLVLNLKVWTEIHTDAPALRVTVLDVGQGDAILLRSPRGKTLLVDAGPRYDDWDAGRAYILPYLARHGIRRIDAAVITHPHEDHYGGFWSIIVSVPVETLFVADIEYREPRFLALLQQAEHHGITICKIRRGRRLSVLQPAEVWVLAPAVEGVASNGNANDLSLVLQARYGMQTVLLPGDAERQAEQTLLAFGDLLQADLLKVGHHGSITSTTTAFLDAVRPREAVISCGVLNRFGHPDARILRRLQHYGVRTWRTDLNGSVFFRLDGKRHRAAKN